MAGSGFNKELCETSRNMVMKHDREIYGNGKTGLKTQVEMNTEFRQRVTAFGWAIIVSIVLSFIAQTAFLTSKINSLEKQSSVKQSSYIQLSDK